MRLFKLKSLFTLLFVGALLFQPGFQSLAEEAIPKKAAPPPIEAVNKIDSKKLEIAKILTDWVQETLQGKNALVAVVSRKGGEDARKHDRTGMAHSGIAVYDPRAQTWLIYNLLNRNPAKDAPPVSTLWRTAPLDFFYGQTGYDQDALVLIPDAETQMRMYEAIVNGNYKKLHFTRNYNLLSRYDGTTSLNCNKWILMNIAAARGDNYDPIQVLEIIRQGFEPGLIYLNAIEKSFAKKKPNVRPVELPTRGPIPVVTVQSLYDSKLFEEKLFRLAGRR